MPVRRVVPGLPPWTLAVAAMLLIELASALSVSLFDLVGANGTAWLRTAFGTTLLWIIAPPDLKSLRRKDVPTLIALGVVTGTMSMFFLGAIERIPLGTAVAIEFMGPLIVAGVTSNKRSALIWPVLAFAGVLLLTEPWEGQMNLPGIAYAVGAGTCWAVYNLLTQRVGDRFSGVTGLSLTLPVATLTIMPFGLPQVISGTFTWWLLPAALGIAMISPMIGLGLEMLALHRMTQTAFGTLQSVEPAFALLIGLVVLGQFPTWLQLLGIATVVVAGAAAQRGGTRTTVSADTEVLLPPESLDENEGGAHAQDAEDTADAADVESARP